MEFGRIWFLAAGRPLREIVSEFSNKFQLYRQTLTFEIDNTSRKY